MVKGEPGLQMMAAGEWEPVMEAEAHAVDRDMATGSPEL